MLLAFDKLSIKLALPKLVCFTELWTAVTEGETMIAETIMKAGYKAIPLMSRKFEWDYCKSSDEHPDEFRNLGIHNHYGGSASIHPFDTMFIKTKYYPEDYQVIVQHSKWVDESNYSSYDHCYHHNYN